MSKLLTVFGATGQQGGALLDHVLTHPELTKTFALRGITRDVSKPSAIALKERGVEIVQVKSTHYMCLEGPVPIYLLALYNSRLTWMTPLH